MPEADHSVTRNPYYRGPVSDHFDGTRFHLPDGSTDKTRGALWRLMRTPFAAWPKGIVDPPAAPPLARVNGEVLRVTSIGHASHLIQTRGHNILVDPVWSLRASPLAFAGPKRVRPPGIALDALPPIAAALAATSIAAERFRVQVPGEVFDVPSVQPGPPEGEFSTPSPSC